MADNITAKANTGSGTEVLATDDIGGIHYPRAKVGWGADGAYNDVSTANPLPISDAGGSITVDGTVGVSGTVTVSGGLTDTQLRATPVPIYMKDSSNTTVDPVLQQDHDAADSGQPIKIGFKATTSLSARTMVSNADRTDAFAGIDGVQIVRPHTNLEDIVQECDTAITSASAAAFASGLAAPGAGIRLYITAVTVVNYSAVHTFVNLTDGSGGSVLWSLPAPANSGFTQVFNPPLRLTANTALGYDPQDAVTGLNISANGFKSKV